MNICAKRASGSGGPRRGTRRKVFFTSPQEKVHLKKREAILTVNATNLVVVADDLGASSSINRAVAGACDRGILTAASIVAGGEAYEEAVQIARSRRLSVGLHVTLCDGRAVLPHSRIPDLADRDGTMESNPVKAWLKCTRPGILPQIEAEIEAQFDRLETSGLVPTHVDSHHHLHMNPPIFKALCKQAARRGVTWIRIPAEPLSDIVALRSRARGMMSFAEWATFGVLKEYNLGIARRYGLENASRVYGLSRTGDIDVHYLLRVVERMRGPLNELFTHPDDATESGLREFEALTSREVRDRLASLGVGLVGYRELSKQRANLHSVCREKGVS